MRRWAIVMLLCTAAGCSSFDRDWQMASDRPHADVTGAWTGTWRSQACGHHGDLRAIVTRLDGDTYQARYHATWGWLSGEYTADMHVTKHEDDRVEFTSEKDLGWLFGGVYQSVGHLTPDEFNSQYKSKEDYGTYTLKRPCRAASPAGIHPTSP